MKLEEKLISLRKEKGLSQMKLAEMMNVSIQSLCLNWKLKNKNIAFPIYHDYVQE